MIAVVSAYIGAAGATRVAEAQARMNEDGQAVLTILSQQMRMAGNNPKQPNYPTTLPKNQVYATSTFIIRGCDGPFTSVSAASLSALACSGTSGADSVAVTYEADKYNTIPNTAGSPTDCLGQALPPVTGVVNMWTGAASVPTNVTYTVADNRFYVGTSTAVTTPSLFCKGNGGGSGQALVENVEDLQFVYGTAPTGATPSTLVVAGYLDASEFTSASTKMGSMPSDEARWGQVVAVRICAVMRSERPVVQDAESAGYIKCNGLASGPQADLRLRRAYSTTVVLRNRVPS